MYIKASTDIPKKTLKDVMRISKAKTMREAVRAEVTLLSEKRQVVLCQPALLELFNGHQKSRDRHSVTVPDMDVLIYSIAQYYGLKILAIDKRFSLIDAKLKKGKR